MIKKIDPRNIGKLYPTYDVKMPTKGFINSWTIAFEDSKMPIVSFSFSKVCNFISNTELKCLKVKCIIIY